MAVENERFYVTVSRLKEILDEIEDDRRVFIVNQKVMAVVMPETLIQAGEINMLTEEYEVF